MSMKCYARGRITCPTDVKRTAFSQPSWNVHVSFLEIKCAHIFLPKLLYFEWSPPWHVGWRLSGGGCQDSMGCQFVEELRFVSASRPPPRLRQQHQQLLTKFHFHITPVIHLPLFSILRLNTPKPNPNVILCAHRVSILSITKFLSTSTYVSLIWSGEGRHTTHLLKCVLLFSTSQTDWMQSSDVLSDISFDILSDISSDISSDILSDISFDISSDILSDIFLTYLLTLFLTYLLTFFLTYLLTCFLTFFLTYQNQNLTSTASQKKAALQTLYLPHTMQQK